MLGWTFGIFKTFGFTLTPGIATGRIGFIVISFGIHFKQRIGFGIVIPIFPIWGLVKIISETGLQSKIVDVVNGRLTIVVSS